MTASTRLQVRQQVARDSGLGVLLAATGDGAADFTTFVDGTVRTIAGDLVILDEGAPLVITSTGTTAAVWGEESRVSSTAITSAGIITVAPAFSAKVKANQTGEAWHRDLVTVQTVNDAIDWVISKVCCRWAFPVLTFLKDGDFWKKTINTSEWAVSNATQSRVAFAFPDYMGKYIHRVTNTGAGAATQAARVTFVLPLGDIRPTDQVRVEFTTNAFATVGTTITAWAMTLTLRPLLTAKPETFKGSWVGYKESVLDVVAASASAQVYCKPGAAPSKWELGCAYVIRNETARGTLGNGWTWIHLNIGGKMLVGQQTPELIHQVRAATKVRLLQVAGICPLWLDPVGVAASDFLEYQNEATATVAGSSVLWVYNVRR